jgi:glutamate dehydrogenase
MNHFKKNGPLSQEQLAIAMKSESLEFEKFYHFLEKHLPSAFFEEINHEEIMLITHQLSTFHRNRFFSHLQFKSKSLILSLDSEDADVKTLELFNLHGIKTYRSFLSDVPFQASNNDKKLKITFIGFTEVIPQEHVLCLHDQKIKELFETIPHSEHGYAFEEFSSLLKELSPMFLSSFDGAQTKEIVKLFLRAQSRDHCQYFLEKETLISKEDKTHLLLAWKNTPKHHFLLKVAKLVFRHKLTMNDVNICYANAYEKNPILLMSFGIKASAPLDLLDFMKELVTLKYFEDDDKVGTHLVEKNLISGNEGNLLRCLINLIHQTLLHADLNLFSHENIEEAFCRHPEITEHIVKLFDAKFNPKTYQIEKFKELKKTILSIIDQLDTGQELNDTRRRAVFFQAVNIINSILKTNYYRKNKSAFSFRLDANYLNDVPYAREEKFPELPYGIFFIQGMHFISFHVRFKDISRGGLRSVIPRKEEQLYTERNNIFSECYNLSYTQQKKNKDVPEGGSKAVILLEPFDRLFIEKEIYQKELKEANVSPSEIKLRLQSYDKEQKIEYLYQAQRAFIHSLITLTNYSEDGFLRAKEIVDHYGRAEYIYLGPDENLYNPMIEWIASYSEKCHYPLKKAFITSKPSCGINHKEYGVTSLGVNVYMEEMLNFLDINPKEQTFTIKMTGGPDGDVAGNQIYNLYRFYPKTAKLLALIDGSGTLYDPNGVDLEIFANLFKEGKPLAFYPPNKLSSGGFLLNTQIKNEENPYSQKTKLYENKEGKLHESWISSSEMNHLLRYTVHKTKSDIFIPAGGRPRTLNSNNYYEFLDENGNPTSKAIVEGANLYLTKEARVELENLGVLIIKDSSANKGGVICSSLEVLTALTMPEMDFIKYKKEFMPEILEHIEQKALLEARLLLKTHAETNEPLTYLSDLISEKINKYTYELLDYLQDKNLSHSLDNPLMQCLVEYCPPFIKNNYKTQILTQIPDMHQKAMISCFIASKLVYARGVRWAPSIVDILPLIAKELPVAEE